MQLQPSGAPTPTPVETPTPTADPTPTPTAPPTLHPDPDRRADGEPAAADAHSHAEPDAVAHAGAGPHGRPGDLDGLDGGGLERRVRTDAGGTWQLLPRGPERGQRRRDGGRHLHDAPAAERRDGLRGRTDGRRWRHGEQQRELRRELRGHVPGRQHLPARRGHGGPRCPHDQPRQPRRLRPAVLRLHALVARTSLRPSRARRAEACSREAAWGCRRRATSRALPMRARRSRVPRAPRSTASAPGARSRTRSASAGMRAARVTATRSAPARSARSVLA